MVDAMVLLDAQGPSQLSADFESPADGSVMFVLSGTAWTQNAPCLVGINLLLDGQVIGEAMCFANQSANHQALRSTFIIFDNMTIGEHSIAIGPANTNTVIDQNDYFQVTLIF